MRIACLQTPAFALDQARAAAAYLLEAVDAALEVTPRPDLLLLPEIAYPAYYLAGVTSAADLDHRLAAFGGPSTEVFAKTLADRARQSGTNIAAGLALRGHDGRLRNMMILFDRTGRELIRAGKQFLWHFDAQWFAPGEPPQVVDLDGLPAGLFICCDGRAPEIPRRLALGGARLLLDATNWVSSGGDPRNLPNAQPDYMMRVRCLENGTWFAAANKVGREADSIVYCGKSCVIGPDGRVAAMASTDRPERLVVEIPDSLPGAGTGGLAARRAGEYPRLGHGPAPGLAPGPAPAPYVAVVQTTGGDAALKVLLADLVLHGAALALLPAGEQPLAYWQALSADLPLLLAAVGRASDQEVLWLLERGRVLGTYAKGHLSPADRAAGLRPGPAEPPVWATPLGRIGVMIGEDGLVPEVARGLAFAGADLILWPHRLTQDWVEPFVRTRAAENRVYVAAAGPAEPGGQSLIADPGGVPVCRTFPGVRQAVTAACYLALSRHKQLVPGTEAFGLPRYPEWC